MYPWYVYIGALVLRVFPPIVDGSMDISMLQVVLYGMYAHWRASRIAKGPPSNLIFGHLLEVQKQQRDLYLVAHDYIPRYGKVFPVWLAQRCVIWVAGS